MREELTELLEEKGYEISTAENGKQALEAISQSPLDILITDFSMPEMNGRELINELGKQGYEFPIILNTLKISTEIDLTRFNYKNLQYNYKMLIDRLLEKVQALG